MKNLLTLQVLVLAGLLFVGVHCLTYTKPEEPAAISTTELRKEFLGKLEADFPAETHASLVNAVKSIVASEASGTESLLATFAFIRALGYALIFLAIAQGASLYYSWRLRVKNV
jgi:hypothetical protein